jgi:uncharacterized protein
MTILLLLAAIALPPKPTHYVTDRAGVLKNAGALDAKLANFERQTSDQVLVYVDRHLPPNTTIEEMGSEAMRQWGVGQKGKDNGAILFVFTGDRKMRIEVGYGLEASLTDAKSKRITSTVIKPEFQHGDFDAGINKGVDAMLATVRGEPYKGAGKTVAETKQQPAAIGPMGCVFLVSLWLLLVTAAAGAGDLVQGNVNGRSSFCALLIVPALAIFVLLWRSVPSTSDYRSVAFFGLIGPLAVGVAFSFRSALSAFFASAGGTSSSDSSSSSSWSSGSSSSFSSSSDSSSSFSGGGGSGGGGGASDSW